MRPFLACLMMVMIAACTPEQSKAIGNQPKKTVDKVTTDINQAMQQSGQGSDRLKESDSK